MDLTGWEAQYRQEAASATERQSVPNPLLVEVARDLPPGRALDLACGSGRNALWLAEHSWNVTAVDGSATAVEILRGHAGRLGVPIDVRVADLENAGFTIAPN